MFEIRKPVVDWLQTSADVLLNHPDYSGLMVGIYRLLGKEVPEVENGSEELVLKKELSGLAERMKEYEGLFQGAEEIGFVFGCDDGRVGAPPIVQTINGKQTLLVYVPRIGGGVPEKDLVQFLRDKTVELRGSTDNVSVYVTQHGSTAEVTQACDHKDISECTCGLRKVFSEYEEELSILGDMLREDQESGRKTYDALSEHLRIRINMIHGATQIPHRLIRIAAEKNMASNITQNATFVWQSIVDYGLFPDSAIKPAYYDHNAKIMYPVNMHDELPFEKFSVTADVEQKWNHEYQNPSGLVISFGPEASFTPDGIVLPSYVGVGINNDFTAVAPGITEGFLEEDLFNALAEASYAAGAYQDAVEGHPHNDNFTDMKYCAILCDNKGYVSLAQQVLTSEHFKTTLAPSFAALGSIKLVNIETEEVSVVAVPSVDLGSGGGNRLTTAMIKQDGDFHPFDES
jgi:hypothetical protein